MKKATVKAPLTAGGGFATPTPNPTEELRRATMASLLWENVAYESGMNHSERLKALTAKVPDADIAAIAVEARNKMYLRHIPLFLVNELSAKKPVSTKLVAETLGEVIQRPDEIAEFLALYWEKGRKMLSKGVRQGLDHAFGKFNEYSFAKNAHPDAKIKLRDALFMSHAKPRTPDQEILFKKIVDNTLATPDTWETNLSAGADKRSTFERLLRERKLGGLATLRNLRNMIDSGVDSDLIKDRLENGTFDKVLPYRFITAVGYAPAYEKSLEIAMTNRLKNLPKLPGKTLFILDTSGSMGHASSRHGTATRVDMGISTLIIGNELCADPTIYCTAGSDGHRRHATDMVPRRSGFALRDSIVRTAGNLGGGGIFLVQCLDHIASKEKSNFDRVLVFTDEQDCDNGVNPNTAKKLGKFNYIMNVSSEAHGIGYQAGWTTITGFSENIYEYIRVTEGL